MTPICDCDGIIKICKRCHPKQYAAHQELNERLRQKIAALPAISIPCDEGHVHSAPIEHLRRGYAGYEPLEGWIPLPRCLLLTIMAQWLRDTQEIES